MEGTRVVLVRHGESLAQETRVVGGHQGCTGLSELGRRQAHALRARLERTGELRDAAAVYTSVMPRAIETAEIIAPAINGSVASQRCDFCEHHPGEGDGLTWEEYERRFPTPEEPWHPDQRRVPGSETWNEMHARVSQALDQVVADHAGELVVIVCHGGVIVQAMAKWLGLGPVDNNRAWLDPCNTSLTEWRFGASRFAPRNLPVELVRFNDFAHLAPPDFGG